MKISNTLRIFRMENDMKMYIKILIVYENMQSKLINYFYAGRKLTKSNFNVMNKVLINAYDNMHLLQSKYAFIAV